MKKSLILMLIAGLGLGACTSYVAGPVPPPPPGPVVTTGAVVVGVQDRPYYLHGPGYWVGRRYYVWVPGHWVHRRGTRFWVHGHYSWRR